MKEALAAPTHETLDAGGMLLAPPFVDAHFHMDATLSYGLPRVNQSGTLLEGIALWGELKPLLTYDALAGEFNELRLFRDPECPACGVHGHPENLPTYADVCAI